MSKVKAAVIGCGTIGRTRHIPAYAASAQAELAYLADIRRERADELAEKYGVPHAVEDFHDILADPSVEVVSVCTPNDTHAPIVIECLDAGKNVLCEKPAAVNARLAREMKAAADRNGKILNIGVVNRFNTAVNRVKELIEAGELGRLYHIYCSFRAHRSIPGLGGPFTTKANAGGGVLIDWGVHFLDLIFYAIGSPAVQTVSGAAHSVLGRKMKDYVYLDMWAGPPDYSGTYDVEDFVTGFVRTAGPTLTFNGAWAQNVAEAGMFVEFLGEKAGVKLEYGGGFKLYGAEQGALYEKSPAFKQADPFVEEIESFIRSAAAGEKNRANIDNVLITSEVMDAVYESAASGKEVTL